jgi:hypothetical protein
MLTPPNRPGRYFSLTGEGLHLVATASTLSPCLTCDAKRGHSNAVSPDTIQQYQLKCDSAL